MPYIIVKYTCKYRIKDTPNYWFTLCGKCFNIKTQRLIKQVYKNGCIGYIIAGKFKSLKRLRGKLEKIPKENNKYPF